MIAARLAQVRADMDACARRSGRDPADVKLIAVSKTRPIAEIEEAAAAGQLLFGENRVQELTPKHEALPQLEWHLIGPLQTNKVKYVAAFVHTIHSVDSLHLLAEIEKHAAHASRFVRCLIQINISEEAQKSGVDEAAAVVMLEHAAEFPHLIFDGFMGLAEHSEDAARVQAQFARLRILRETCLPFVNPQRPLTHLSMGMTDDYPLAIAEGATYIRIGGAIFGARA